MSKEKTIDLRVDTARQRDVARKIGRISRKHMRLLEVEVGDFVEVIGPKGSTILQVWQAYDEDEGKDIIRIDGYVRESLGVAVGEYVKVKKARVERGSKVVLAPTYPVRFGGDFVHYVKNLLMYKAVVRGEAVFVQIPFGEPMKFIVVSTQPSQAVYVDEATELIIKEEPVREEALARGIPRVTWEDIGDLEDVKDRIREIVEIPMRHPELFKHLGIEPPKGVLLYGPPGVGKTLLAKALANEIGAYFIVINGPEIMSKFYGESEARLREIFQEAENNAPSIIFIDEIDAIAPKREEVVGEVEKRVVAQLLALMDGLKERGRIIVIGATNRIDAVDPALRRPGRFDREIEIPPPDKRARKEILLVHTRNVPLSEDVNIDEFAEITHGYTGADLAALVKEAAMSALRKFLRSESIDLNKPIPPDKLTNLKVTKGDFLEALKLVHPTLMREVFVEVPEVRWSDIGGLDDVKQQLREAVEWPLRYPIMFEKMGIKPPRGVLLYGPPGCGKTLLAKAVATESGANFIAIKGPEILSKWVGESERAVREVFRRARQVAPAVIFFDEIDAITPARGYRHDAGVTDRIVNQLLAEMDGITVMKNVVVIGATNRADIIDPALLRPGRFDRVIYVPPPDRKARLEILKVHTRNVPLASDVNLEKLAELTEGYSGADIEALVREAVMIALREKLEARPVSMDYFMRALKAVKPSLSKDITDRYAKLYEDLRRLVI
ncbi:MAG: CDC48 family AAA ATPase [Sulfolobales archaeon]|nr:CDC48 family AAA ATPase [Sulfolobales archaeon]MCX8186784.1 CDC48 family AAA ATPase [Sulfolobales archaeon]MDW7969883.1 CDC48 family AAA ATPase [Sulfolobales archaeon]